MSVEPGVVDANVLAYAVNGDGSQHGVSRALVEAARDPTTRLYVTSQILCEFYSIITNVRRFPKTSPPAEGVGILTTLLALPGLRVLPMPARVVSDWMQLLQRHPVAGSDVFDLQIAATMLANDVSRIYTFNAGDFEVFSELTVVQP